MPDPLAAAREREGQAREAWERGRQAGLEEAAQTVLSTQSRDCQCGPCQELRKAATRIYALKDQPHEP